MSTLTTRINPTATHANTQTLHGGNVYFLDDKDYERSWHHELLIVGAMAGITLLAALVGICVILGFGWARLGTLMS